VSGRALECGQPLARFIRPLPVHALLAGLTNTHQGVAVAMNFFQTELKSERESRDLAAT
jgi:hypothetical protein